MSQIFLFFSDPDSDSHPKENQIRLKELVHVGFMTPFYQLLFLLIMLGSCRFWTCLVVLVVFSACPLGGALVPVLAGTGHTCSSSPSPSLFKAAAPAHQRRIVSPGTRT